MKDGQAPGAVAPVQQALLRLCRGYTYREDGYEKCKTPVVEDGRKVGEEEVLRPVQVTRRREPSLEAIKLWLSLGPAAGRQEAAGPVYLVDDVAEGDGRADG